MLKFSRVSKYLNRNFSHTKLFLSSFGGFCGAGDELFPSIFPREKTFLEAQEVISCHDEMNDLNISLRHFSYSPVRFTVQKRFYDRHYDEDQHEDSYYEYYEEEGSGLFGKLVILIVLTLIINKFRKTMKMLRENNNRIHTSSVIMFMIIMSMFSESFFDVSVSNEEFMNDVNHDEMNKLIDVVMFCEFILRMRQPRGGVAYDLSQFRKKKQWSLWTKEEEIRTFRTTMISVYQRLQRDMPSIFEGIESSIYLNEKEAEMMIERSSGTRYCINPNYDTFLKNVPTIKRFMNGLEEFDTFLTSFGLSDPKLLLVRCHLLRVKNCVFKMMNKGVYFRRFDSVYTTAESRWKNLRKSSLGKKVEEQTEKIKEKVKVFFHW